jgi:carboxyl-terminal processing protease
MLDQEFGGVGLELTLSEPARGIVVVSPVFGAPAWHAGIAAGDRILAIDGVSTQQMTIDEALRRLRGRPGTPVRLAMAIAADDGPSTRDIALVRKACSVTGGGRMDRGSGRSRANLLRRSFASTVSASGRPANCNGPWK